MSRDNNSVQIAFKNSNGTLLNVTTAEFYNYNNR